MLVTSTMESRIDMWPQTIYGNWLDGRKNAHGTETWHVMVLDEHLDHFLEVARAVDGVTVEEIEGAGETESYALRVGEPGTGWVAP
jgi:hypothetical protein